MAKWHSGIVGFQARYKRELNQLMELKSKNQEAEWDKGFQKIKTECKNSLGIEDDIELFMRPIPNMFEMKVISKEAYDTFCATLGYPKMVSEIYDCPAELDSRS